MPSGTRIDVGVYGLEERHQAPIEDRRDDLIRLIHYFSEQRLFFNINHASSALTGLRAAMDFQFFAERSPGVETRNGDMPRAQSASRQAGRGAPQSAVGTQRLAHLRSLTSTLPRYPGRETRRNSGRLRQGRGSWTDTRSYWK